MKRLIVALAAVPLASAVFGQTGAADAAEVRVTCSAPCYVAPFFTGGGGFVAESVRGGPFGPVDFAVTCGNTVTTGTVEPDQSRIVRQAFTRANGLACDAESGKVEISGLKAGGWYWINDDRNSAVFSLVNSNVLGEGHMRVRPIAPGGVTITSLEGGDASFVKHEMSGRVGIISHILPAPEVPPCDAEENLRNNCELRGSYEIVLKSGDAVVGSDIVRGGDDGQTYFIVTASLAGSGYIPIDPATPPVAAYRIAGPGSTEENPVATPGVNHAFPLADIGIEAEAGSGERCAETSSLRDLPVTVVITATNPEGGLGAVPPLPKEGIRRTVTVSCPE